MRTADAPHDYPAHWPAARSWTRLAVRTRNPLLRPPTRRERVVIRLAFGGLVVLSVAIVLCCLGVFQRGVAAEREQAAQRHRITATVQSAPDHPAVANRYLVVNRTSVSYQFRGATMTGTTATTPGAKAGSPVTVWIDGQGRLTRAPQTRSITVRDTTLAALFGLTALIVLVSGGRAGYDAWSIREHAGAWDADWLRFDRDRRR